MNKLSERTSDIIERKRRYDQRWRANVWVGIKDNNMEKKKTQKKRKRKTAARKRSLSFCQKRRWQVTAKHSYTLDPTKSLVE